MVLESNEAQNLTKMFNEKLKCCDSGDKGLNEDTSSMLKWR